MRRPSADVLAAKSSTRIDLSGIATDLATGGQRRGYDCCARSAAERIFAGSLPAAERVAGARRDLTLRCC